jgi:hypothetical protein
MEDLGRLLIVCKIVGTCFNQDHPSVLAERNVNWLLTVQESLVWFSAWTGD